MFSEFLIVEIKRRYDLRPRVGFGRPSKDPITIEPQVKSVKTQTIPIQNLDQSTETPLMDKTHLTTFNVERDIEREKIPIPLSELTKNPK